MNFPAIQPISVQFSHSVISYCFQPHGLQHTGLPCPSPTPRACSNLCPSSWWCHPTISSSEAPILWPPDVKNWLSGKDPSAGKDWRQEKGTMEDEMVRWHHQLDGHKFEQALEVGDGQGSLACCSPWGHKELDMTEWLNWTDIHILFSDYFPL